VAFDRNRALTALRSFLEILKLPRFWTGDRDFKNHSDARRVFEHVAQEQEEFKLAAEKALNRVRETGFPIPDHWNTTELPRVAIECRPARRARSESYGQVHVGRVQSILSDDGKVLLKTPVAEMEFRPLKDPIEEASYTVSVHIPTGLVCVRDEVRATISSMGFAAAEDNATPQEHAASLLEEISEALSKQPRSIIRYLWDKPRGVAIESLDGIPGAFRNSGEQSADARQQAIMRTRAALKDKWGVFLDTEKGRLKLKHPPDRADKK
jgi:hypothetical protein